MFSCYSHTLRASNWEYIRNFAELGFFFISFLFTLLVCFKTASWLGPLLHCSKAAFRSLSLWSIFDHITVNWDSSREFLSWFWCIFPRDHFKSTFLSKISKPHPKHPWGNLKKSVSREWIRKIHKFYHCHGLNYCIRFPVTIVSPKRNQPKALFSGF